MLILRALALLLVSATVLAFSTGTEPLANAYIENYRDLAVVEMYRTGIPASITLAQGLHESNYGRSPLATKANNHFGIKCKSDWRGDTYFHKDDDLDEHGDLIHSCFRAYQSDIDSYVDHSNFLVFRSHYKWLFDYNKTDYINWAYGLQESGYATDPMYAVKLINKIERYGLSQYDHWENPLKK